jgi:hypothetical protein
LHRGDLLQCYRAIFSHGGGDSGGEVHFHFAFSDFQVAVIIGIFSKYNLMKVIVNQFFL